MNPVVHVESHCADIMDADTSDALSVAASCSSVRRCTALLSQSLAFHHQSPHILHILLVVPQPAAQPSWYLGWPQQGTLHVTSGALLITLSHADPNRKLNGKLNEGQRS